MPHERTRLLMSITFNLLIRSIVEGLPLPSTQTSFEFQVSAGVCFQIVICYCDYSFIINVDDKDHETI